MMAKRQAHDGAKRIWQRTAGEASDREIADATGVNKDTVRRWRRKWQAALIERVPEQSRDSRVLVFEGILAELTNMVNDATMKSVSDITQIRDLAEALRALVEADRILSGK